MSTEPVELDALVPLVVDPASAGAGPDLASEPVESLCTMLSLDERGRQPKTELQRRGLLAVPRLIAWLLRPKSVHEITSTWIAKAVAQELVVRHGRPVLPYLTAYVKQLERPNPFDDLDELLPTRQGHTLTTYIWALDTATELHRELRRAGRPKGQTVPDFRSCCPICGGTRVKRDLEGSDREGLKKVRLFHDRRCKECSALWTPGCPTWGAWTLIGCGGALVATFLAVAFALLFGGTGIPFDFAAVKAQLAAQPDATKLVGLLSGFLLLPGLSSLLFGLRALLGPGRDIVIREWGNGG